MKTKLLCILFIFVFLGWNPANGQNSRTLKQAQKKYQSKDYAGAVDLWIKAFDQESSEAVRQQIAFQLSETYVKMNQLEKAEIWLKDVVVNSQPAVEWLLLKASVQLRLNKPQLAEKTIQKALEEQPWSRQLQDMLGMINRWQKQTLSADFPFEKLNFVSTSYSDYAASWFHESLLVSSSRPGETRQQIDGRTSEFYSGIFEYSKNQFGDFEKLGTFELIKGKNIGTPVFDQLHNRFFFTKCSNVKKRCSIYIISIDPISRKAGKPKPAPFMQKKVHYGHPFVREDGKMLYFVSDSPDGYGGKDIYRISLREDGGFGLAINLGPQVNSSQDELFPTTIGDSLLLFAAERFTGFGGLDLYASKLKDEQAQKSVLLDFPFNSQGDDFYLTIKPGSISGFLSSNRNQNTNDDIYAFEAYPLRTILEGTVKEEHTNQFLSNAEVAIKENKIKSKLVFTDSTGYYRASISAGNSLEILAEKSGYFPERRQILANDSSHLIRQDFILSQLTYPAAISGLVSDKETKKPLVSEKVTINGPGNFYLEVYTDSNGAYRFDSLKPNNLYTVKVTKNGYFSESRICKIPEARKPLLINKKNGVDMDFELLAIQEKKEVVINNIYYDFDKATLRESSKLELNKLVSMLRETPNVIVQINAHTDTRGSHTYNDQLSESRAASVVNYLVMNGINPGRLVSRGLGKRSPLIPNARSEAEHQANRRTTFTVTGTDFKPVVSQNSYVPIENALVYRVQLMATTSRFDPESYFYVLKAIIPQSRFYVNEANNLYRYEVGDRLGLQAAETLKNQILSAGFEDCFIVPYYQGKRITMEEAKQIQP